MTLSDVTKHALLWENASEAARRGNAERPLTHLSDASGRGLR